MIIMIMMIINIYMYIYIYIYIYVPRACYVHHRPPEGDPERGIQPNKYLNMFKSNT